MKKGIVLILVLFLVSMMIVAAPRNDVKVLQVALENSLSEPIGQGVLKWKELVDERGDGSIRLEIYPDSQLGNKTDLLDQMLLGEPVMTMCDGAFAADYGIADMGITMGPFLFDNWDDCWKLIGTEWWKGELSKLEDVGFKVLADNWAYGVRHILTTEPVETVDDLKGLQIRVPTNQVQSKGIAALGATPVGMSLGDVYTALQQGTIDGAENPLSTLYGRKHHEVAKYLILDGHVYSFTSWVCSIDWFNSLTPEQQNLLLTTGYEAGLFNNEIVEEQDQYYLDQMINEGVQVVYPSEEVLQGFKDKVVSFYEDGESLGWSPNLYDTVMTEMGK